MKRLALALASLALTFLAGCGGQGSPADPPPDFRVVPGDGSATVTWTAEPGVDYWIFYGPGTNITRDNWATSGGTAIPGATSPRIVTGLLNDRDYSFTMNARKDSGPGGQGAPTQVVRPRLAGENWQVNPPLGTARLNGLAGGTVLGGFALVAVGNDGVIFSGFNNGPMATATNPSAPAHLNGIFSGLLGFAAVGANGTILTSFDALAWTAATSGTTATLYGGASSVNGVYVAVGAGGTVALSAGGNTTWTTPASGVTTDLYAAANGNQRFVAVGAAGTIIASSDGSGWTTAASGTTNDLRGVTHGFVAAADGTTTNLYIAVGAAGTVVTSTDTVTWTVQPAFTTANLLAVTYGGRFVAVGAGGVVFTSLNGVDWEARSSGTPNDLNAVARQLSGYTAVGEAGTNVSTF